MSGKIFSGLNMLRVDVQSSPASAKLLCSGRIVLGVESETLKCIAMARAEPCLILDLRHVDAIDAAGLGLLAELHCWARQRSRLLTIADPSRPVRRLLALTRLLPLLRITYSVIAEAGLESDYTGDARQAMTA
jgi:anti-anti-sigma factor